jgi:MFS family permease
MVRARRQVGRRDVRPTDVGDRASLGPSYRSLVSAAWISNIGDGIAWTAVPLLAASLTRDERLVAGVDAALVLPWLLVSLPAGALIDRLDRRRVMITADVFRAGAFGLVTVLVVFDALPIAALYALVLSIGVAEVFFDNASQAFLPQIVDVDGLTRANGGLQTAMTVGNQLTGPPLGGLLFAALVWMPFSLEAASFAAAAWLVARIRGDFRPQRGSGPARTLRAEIGEGLRFLWREPVLRALAILLGSMNFLDMVTRSTWVLFAQDQLGLSAFGFGLLAATGALGGAAGGLVADRVAFRLGDGRALPVSVATIGTAYLVVPLVHHPLTAAASFVLVGAASVVWNVITVSLRQEIIPEHLFGRVNSVYRLVSWGVMPIGAIAAGSSPTGSGSTRCGGSRPPDTP